MLGGTVTVSGGSFSEPVDPKNLDESLNAELYSAGSPTPYSYHTDVEAAQNVAGPGDVITDLSGITTEDTTTRYQVILKNGNGTEQVLSIASGAGIVLPVPDGYGGYIFQGWQDGNGNIYQAGATVTIGADTTFTAEWAYIPPADPSYRITIADAAHGTVTADPAAARQGTTVTLTVTPEEGYAVDEITVTDFFGNRVEVSRNSNGTYSFVMPYSQVEVDVTFTRTEEPIRFTDVPEGAYYYDAVYWAVENGVTVGATATTFNPGGSCTRAQMVTFLWRAAGSPEPATTVNPFTDVDANDYYYEAVLWAVENGVTVGATATTFNPGGECTRSQMVTFLWRAAGEPGTGTSSNPFTDVDADDYYCEAVLWAVENGITVGATATTFAPVAVCTRAQAVTFLYRAQG